VGASMDRFLCSSHSATYRQLSTARLARRFVIGVVIFFALVFTEALYCYEASVPNVPVACYGQTLACRIFNDWMSIACDVVLPSVFLVIFGALTIRNARSRFVQPALDSINNTNAHNNIISTRNNERNLTRMLSIQVSLDRFSTFTSRYCLFFEKYTSRFVPIASFRFYKLWSYKTLTFPGLLSYFLSPNLCMLRKCRSILLLNELFRYLSFLFWIYHLAFIVYMPV
jgi:intracellular septation protein A